MDYMVFEYGTVEHFGIIWLIIQNNINHTIPKCDMSRNM